MSTFIKTSKDHMKALQIIEEYSNQCPKCYSNDISNEDNSEFLTCHSCSHQFAEDDYMDKFHITALLTTKGLPHIAMEIQLMDLQEYQDFLINHIY